MYKRTLSVISIFIGITLAQAEPIEGIISSIEPEQMQLTLKVSGAGQKEIKAAIGRGDAKILKQGDAIRGDLVPFGKGKRLQTIWPNDPVKRGTIKCNSTGFPSFTRLISGFPYL